MFDSPLRRRGLAAAAVALCLLLRAAWGWLLAVPNVRLVGHWRVDAGSFAWGDGATLLDEGGALTLSYPPDAVLMPRAAVARAPRFSSLRRGANASAPPRHSVYI